MSNVIGTNVIGTNAIGTNVIGTNAIGTNKKTRKAPCPKGTRYNNKTKRCEPMNKNTVVPVEAEPVEAEPAPILGETLLEIKKKRRTPCPKGTRRNKKGICAPIKNA